MYRLIKNLLNRKIKDERSASYINRRIDDVTSLGVPYHYYAWCPDMSYYNSLWLFRKELLNRRENNTKLVVWKEAIGWKFFGEELQFSPQEAVDRIGNLLSNAGKFSYEKSQWQIYFDRNQMHHYFDIDVYDMNFDRFGHWEIGGLSGRITIDCLL